MQYQVLACDYDGTLAWNGVVDEPTWEALRAWKTPGHKLLLVTGRELPDLQQVCPNLDLFDHVVGENGALLYNPATREERTLGQTPPLQFVKWLRKRNVTPLSVGKVIVATREPYEKAVLEAIRELGLELQVIFNKGAVMVLPPGINKATGLNTLLRSLGISCRQVAGIGDAENDHAFLDACGLGAAVANALPLLKEKADFVTHGHHGAGVVELIDLLLSGAAPAPASEPGSPRRKVAAGNTA